MVDGVRRTLVALTLQSIPVLLPGIPVLLSAVPAGAQEVNVIESIRVVQTAAPAGTIPSVEITVRSNRPFRVGALPNVLRVATSSGDREFLISRPPDTGPDAGSLEKLVFTVSWEDFNGLPEGAGVSVQYGSGAEGRDRRDFGALNKNQVR